ncbi:MAG: hypothetical protein HY323_07235 [Betaproteobacteria bacterium]|nr:hypothetical protein [Betaproteobacteria bacterium]
MDEQRLFGDLATIRESVARTEGKVDRALASLDEHRDRLNEHSRRISSLQRWRFLLWGGAAVLGFLVLSRDKLAGLLRALGVLALALVFPVAAEAAPLTCYQAVRQAYREQPTSLQAAADMMGACWGLPPGVLRAIVEQENRAWDPGVPDGGAGEVGLAHMKPATVLLTLGWPTTPENLTRAAGWLREPISALYWSGRYLAQVVRPACRGREELACYAAGYNAGAGAARYISDVAERHDRLVP